VVVGGGGDDDDHRKAIRMIAKSICARFAHTNSSIKQRQDSRQCEANHLPHALLRVKL
jgi:hypothetical protein